MAIFIFLMQIFQMCFFGQEINSKYKLLSIQLYTSDWPEMLDASKRNTSHGNAMKIVIYFMMVLNRETNIMVGKVVPLNLETFSSVKNIVNLNSIEF